MSIATLTLAVLVVYPSVLKCFYFRAVHTEAIFSVYEHVMRWGFLLDMGRFREPIYSGEMLGDLELDELDLLIFPAIVLVD